MVVLFIVKCWIQAGVPSVIKRSVKPTKQRAGKPKAISNSIKQRESTPLI